MSRHSGISEITIFESDDLEQAGLLYQSALEMASAILEAEPDQAEAHASYSVMLERLGEYYLERNEIERSRQSFLDSLAAQERAVELDPQNLRHRRDLATGWSEVGKYLFRTTGEIEKELDAYHEAVRIRKAILEDDPNDVASLESLSTTEPRIRRLEQVPNQ